MNVRNFYKAIILIVLSALMILIISISGLLSLILVSSKITQMWNVPLKTISNSLVKTEQGYQMEDSQIIKNNNLWAMLLDHQGKVVWQERKPAEIPNSYTITDVASFSRWYLKDYPVHVWVREDGLFVLGSPKHSTWKYLMELDYKELEIMPYWAIGIFLLSLICVIGLSSLILRRWFRSDQKARDEARSNWINGISHDIRTPLSMVMGYASQLEQDEALPRIQQKKAAMIRCQSEIIKSLVGDLNLTMRLDYEMQPLRRKMIFPAALVRQTAADFLNSGLEECYDLQIQIEPKAQSMQICADETLLRRALSNLVNNCVRHNTDGCSIVIGLKMEGKECILWVQNSAQGTPEIKTEQSQPLQSDGLAEHGTGLRLVEQIVKAHQGRVLFHIERGIFCCELCLPLK